MIRKLQIKLIAVAMLSLFLVLSVIMASVNVLNYRGVVQNADELLAFLAQNGGRFPVPDGVRREEEPPGEPPALSPETPYETRYFTVSFDENDAVTAVDTGRIAAVDTQTAIEYAQRARTRADGGGFLSGYRYLVCPTSDGTRVIFLDCGKSLSTFRSFLWSSLAVSALGLAAVFILLLLLSARIVNPMLESYEKQRRFITDAGHEIKTPLTIIDADAELLAMDCGENEWLQDIRVQTKRLSSLTNDLIFLSRMEEGQAKLQMLSLPFSELVAETARSFQSLARTQDKLFETEIQPMLSVCGDEKALRQMVGILLDNAVKYCAPNGEISLTLNRQGRAVRLSVTNTSRPIGKEQLRRLFDRFYRADESRSSRTGGYGIGLSIAQAVVQAHRGKISSASSDGGSLTVTVLLPEDRPYSEWGM